MPFLILISPAVAVGVSAGLITRRVSTNTDTRRRSGDRCGPEGRGNHAEASGAASRARPEAQP